MFDSVYHFLLAVAGMLVLIGILMIYWLVRIERQLENNDWEDE